MLGLHPLRGALAIGVGACAVIVGACSSSSDSGNEPALTFSETIEPLIQDKCQKCHRPDGIAPFSLTTYEEVKAMGLVARGKVERREMPPWGAFDSADCKMGHKFKDDLSLTDAQVQQFVSWVDQGMPEGDASKRPAPRTFAAPGLPDKTHTFGTAKPWEVAPNAKDDIRCFPIDPGFTEDTWVAATNVTPGDPRVVHHVIVYTDPKREGMQKAGDAGSYPCFGGPEVKNPSLLLAWAPGVPPTSYGDETALKVDKGSHLVLQVHYHPDERVAVPDQTKFELRTIPTRPQYVAQVLLIGNASKTEGALRLLPGPNDPPSGPEFKIPANVADHTESMVLDVPEMIGDIAVPPQRVIMVGSHMHWAGVNMKIDIERRNPAEGQPKNECLLGTPKYDFNWQRGYTYDSPFDDLPLVIGGDRITFTCTYDNTTNNPHVRKAMSELRLSSPQDIKLGEQTLDEMCLGVLVTSRRATPLD